MERFIVCASCQTGSQPVDNELGRGGRWEIHGVQIFEQINRKVILSICSDSVKIGGRDSSVGIATSYGLGGSGIESRWGTRFSAPVRTVPGAHPASYTMGTGSLSWG